MYKTRNTGTGDGMGGMLLNIPGNVAKRSGGECPQRFRGMSVLLKGMRTQEQSKISRNL